MVNDLLKKGLFMRIYEPQVSGIWASEWMRVCPSGCLRSALSAGNGRLTPGLPFPVPTPQLMIRGFLEAEKAAAAAAAAAAQLGAAVAAVQQPLQQPLPANGTDAGGTAIGSTTASALAVAQRAEAMGGGVQQQAGAVGAGGQQKSGTVLGATQQQQEQPGMGGMAAQQQVERAGTAIS